MFPPSVGNRWRGFGKPSPSDADECRSRGDDRTPGVARVTVSASSAFLAQSETGGTLPLFFATGDASCGGQVLPSAR